MKTAAHESLVWINDRSGRDYVCYVDDFASTVYRPEAQKDKVIARCLDVSRLIVIEKT